MELIRIVIALVSQITSLGIPPSVSDEVAFRGWCQKLCGLLTSVAQIVPSEVDDGAVNLLTNIVNNDSTWEALYGMIVMAWNDEPIVVSEDITAAQAIDPALVIQIVLAIIELIRNWKK